MNNRNKIFLALIISVILHFLFLGAGSYWSSKNPISTSTPPSSEPVEVELLNKHPYQIADIAPPAHEEKPKDAKFLGLYDSTVKEEKVATSPLHAGGSSKSVSKKKNQPEEKTTKNTEKDTKKKSNIADGEGLEIATKKSPKVAMKTPEKKSETGGGQEEDLFEGAMPEEYFPNYKVGDHTYLNVLKFPKVSYFVRMKKIFKTTFNPMQAIRSAMMNNQVSKGQVEVVMAVTVDRSGRLDDLKVIRSSGITEYDREALRTIRDSSPFASPPKEFLDNSSMLRMAWTFTVYL